jgi:hypothetical protein
LLDGGVPLSCQSGLDVSEVCYGLLPNLEAVRDCEEVAQAQAAAVAQMCQAMATAYASGAGGWNPACGQVPVAYQKPSTDGVACHFNARQIGNGQFSGSGASRQWGIQEQFNFSVSGAQGVNISWSWDQSVTSTIALNGHPPTTLSVHDGTLVNTSPHGSASLNTLQLTDIPGSFVGGVSTLTLDDVFTLRVWVTLSNPGGNVSIPCTPVAWSTHQVWNNGNRQGSNTVSTRAY